MNLVISLLLSYHRRGYEFLRFMPFTPADSYHILIGSRKQFSERDGSFIPRDLRSRCIRVNPESVMPEFDLFDVFRGYSDPYNRPIGIMPPATVRSKEEVDEIEAAKWFKYNEWLEECYGRDPQYTTWLRALADTITATGNLVPCRGEIESASPNAALINLQRQSLRSSGGEFAGLQFSPPPAGTAASSGPWKPKSEDIALAQPRPVDALDLIWPGRSNRRSPTHLDNWYENNAPSSDA